MAALAQQSLRELLDRVASPTPGPSAGACAAWSCALGAALVELAAEVTLSHEELGSAHARMRGVSDLSRGLRERLVELGERDVAAYAAVLEARRAGDEQRVAAALSDAADPPLAIAEMAAEVAALATEAARDGAPALRGDALAGARLAAAAAEATAELVAIDLAASPDDPRVARARAAAQLGD